MLTALALTLMPATAGAPLQFSCAAPLQHYGQVRQILAGPGYRVSGDMSPVTLEDIPDPALPVRMEGGNIPSHSRSADVTLASEAGPWRYVSLRVTPRYGMESGERVADVDVQFRSDEAGEDELRELGTIRTRGLLWEDLPFVIEAHSDRVTVEAGGRRTEVPVALGQSASLDFACIGGTFAFDDLVWGDLPPTP